MAQVLLSLCLLATAFRHSTAYQNMNNEDVEETPKDLDFRRRHRLSWLLDNSIRLPGGFRIGLDGIIGLVPGVGDMLAGFLSTLILHQAFRRNMPKMVLARMLINILIDVGIGAIPIVGDLFDFWWKANLRNARLMDRYEREPGKVYRQSTIATIGFIVGTLALIGLLIAGVVALVALVWGALTT